MPDYKLVHDEWTTLAEYRNALRLKPKTTLKEWATDHGFQYSRLSVKNVEVRRFGMIDEQVKHCEKRAAEAKEKIANVIVPVKSEQATEINARLVLDLRKAITENQELRKQLYYANNEKIKMEIALVKANEQIQKLVKTNLEAQQVALLKRTPEYTMQDSLNNLVKDDEEEEEEEEVVEEVTDEEIIQDFATVEESEEESDEEEEEE